MIGHCPDKLRDGWKILAAVLLTALAAGCSSMKSSAPHEAPVLRQSPAPDASEASGAADFLTTGLWADYKGEENTKMPLLVPEGLSTFPSTARQIFWYARPDARSRFENVLGARYSIRWITPEGSTYEENFFGGSLLEGGVLMSGMKVPFKLAPSLSGRWRVEVKRVERDRETLADSRDFWLIRTAFDQKDGSSLSNKDPAG